MGNCHLISSKWINFLKAQPFVFCRSCFLVALIIKRSLEEAVEGQARNGQFPIQFCWQNPPLDCVLGMQNQSRGRARKMSSSFFNCCGYEKLLIVTWLLRQGGNRGCFRCLMADGLVGRLARRSSRCDEVAHNQLDSMDSVRSWNSICNSQRPVNV